MVDAFVSVTGGAVALLLCLWMLRTMIRGEREARQARAAGKDVFVGGLRYHATGGVNSGARTNFTRPLGLLEVAEGVATLSLNREGRVLARAMHADVHAVTHLSAEEVDRLETDFGSSRGLRFRMVDASDPRDGLVFWPKRRDRQQILASLQAAGFPTT